MIYIAAYITHITRYVSGYIMRHITEYIMQYRQAMITTLAAFALMTLYGAAYGTAQADTLVTDVSTDEVAIQADFTGQNILLFGAFDDDAPGAENRRTDVIIIIRGPDQKLVIRRKSRRLGIWVNQDKWQPDAVPAYYAIASTRPLKDITTPARLAYYQAGLDFLPVRAKGSEDRAANDITENNIKGSPKDSTKAAMTPADKKDFLNGLIRNKRRQGLYRENEGGIQIIGNRLFRAEIAMPPGIPIGTYEAEILLFRNGQIMGRQTNRIYVDIVGVEQYLYGWAQQRPVLYGVTGVLLSIFCGWGAAVLFRRYS